MRRKSPEDDLQITCVKWWDLQYPKHRLNLFHVPNGGSRNIVEAAKFKKMGVRAGVSDLVLIWDRPYFIELKAPKGRQEESQKLFQDAVVNKGYQYFIVRSLDEFIALVRRLTNSPSSQRSSPK